MQCFTNDCFLCSQYSGFGTVLRGQRRSDTLPVAIKTMPNSSPKQKRENMWEVGLLHQSQHPNVVALYEAFDWAGAVWLVMERLEGGSLAHAVALSGGFREPHVAYASERVLVALEFMHKRNLVHRDLKSANLMFTTAGDVKIIDFGLCRDVSRAPGSKLLIDV
jgi:serine/threonine protein kinase